MKHKAWAISVVAVVLVLSACRGREVVYPTAKSFQSDAWRPTKEFVKSPVPDSQSPDDAAQVALDSLRYDAGLTLYAPSGEYSTLPNTSDGRVGARDLKVAAVIPVMAPDTLDPGHLASTDLHATDDYVVILRGATGWTADFTIRRDPDSHAWVYTIASPWPSVLACDRALAKLRTTLGDVSLVGVVWSDMGVSWLLVTDSKGTESCTPLVSGPLEPIVNGMALESGQPHQLGDLVRPVTY